MVEPFVEVNSTGTRKHYTRFNDYLNLKIAELPRFGLDPVLTFEDIPQKVTIAYGLAVSRVCGGCRLRGSDFRKHRRPGSVRRRTRWRQRAEMRPAVRALLAIQDRQGLR